MGSGSGGGRALPAGSRPEMMLFQPRAEALVMKSTYRLKFRRMTSADVPFIMAMEADPEVMRHTTGRIAPTESRRMELLGVIAAVPDAGLGHWCIEQCAQAIGWVSLTLLEQTGRTQLAYRLARSAWGQGFATEAGEAALAYAQVALGLAECVAVVWPANTSSLRVLSKLGFRKEGTATHYGHEVEVHVRTF